MEKYHRNFQYRLGYIDCNSCSILDSIDNVAGNSFYKPKTHDKVDIIKLIS